MTIETWCRTLIGASVPERVIDRQRRMVAEPARRVNVYCLRGRGDARRGEIYYAHYDSSGAPVGECRIGRVETLVGEVRAPTWFVSSAMGPYADPLRSVGVVCGQSMFPAAAILGRLGRQPAQSLPLEPIYLRAVEYRPIPAQPSLGKGSAG